MVPPEKFPGNWEDIPQAGINYCMLKKSFTPTEYGEAIAEYCNISEEQYPQKKSPFLEKQGL